MNDTCIHRYDNLRRTECYILSSIILLIIILKWRYGEIVIKYLKFVLDFLTNVWLISRLCNVLNLSCQVDVFTVYFVVWQFTYVFSEWISHELPWFSFNLQRGLLCLWMSFSAIIFHDIGSSTLCRSEKIGIESCQNVSALSAEKSYYNHCIMKFNRDCYN